jgi:hypothetical protein
MKKVYYESDVIGKCYTKCKHGYNGTDLWKSGPVYVGSIECRKCNFYIDKGIDTGGDYVFCSKENEKG